LRWKFATEKVANVHGGNVTEPPISDESTQSQRRPAIVSHSAESVMLDSQPATEAKHEFTIEALGGVRHADCYSANLPAVTQKTATADE